jgi:small subunit ribosomal protein S1
VVKEVDVAKRRISLSIKDTEGDPWIEVPEKYAVGNAVTGTLERKEKFGYFIALEPGVTGLMPRSKLAQSEQAVALEKLKPGDTVTVRIDHVNAVERKLTLVPADAGDEGDWRRFSGENAKGLGSLGEKLQKVLRTKNDP